MTANIFLIENGEFGLAPVDTAAVGYDPTWQAPGGKTLANVVLADYDTGSTTWTCQVTSGALTASPDTTTTDTPATFCDPATSTPTPAETTFELAVSFLQDINVSTGLNRFLFEHDTEEVYWYLGFNGTDPPKAIGRARAQSGAVGGDARTALTADLTLPCARKPDIEFGNATTSVIVGGDGTITPGALETSSTAKKSTAKAAA